MGAARHQTLVDMLESFPSQEMRVAKSWGKERQTLTYGELYAQASNCAKGLLELGLVPGKSIRETACPEDSIGDRVIMLTGNSPFWLAPALGICKAGLTEVTRAADAPPQDINYVIEHTGAKLVIVDTLDTLGKISRGNRENLRLVCIAGNSAAMPRGVMHLSELEDIGRHSCASLPRVMPDQVATIIYTSGTTKHPKGVMLTHRNLLASIDGVLGRIPFSNDDAVVSFLPLSHVFGKIVDYVAAYRGCEVFHTSPKTLGEDLTRVKPTVLPSVPQVWDKIYKDVREALRKRGTLAERIVSYGLNACERNKRRDEQHPSSLLALHDRFVARRMAPFFDRVRSHLGGRLRVAISGAAPLSPEAERFFDLAGIVVVEGYGMTEIGIVTLREPDKSQLQTVGPPVHNVDITIKDPVTGLRVADGQVGNIYVRGASVCVGYYREPRLTADAMSEDGFFNTEDLGEWTPDGCLKIRGRISARVKLVNGEWVNTAVLQNELSRSDYIETAIVLAQSNWKRPGALVVPRFDRLSEYCRSKGIYAATREEIVREPTIRGLFQNEINQCVNGYFARHEHIGGFVLLSDSFQPGLELTETYKPKLRIIEEKYVKQIRELEMMVNT